MIGDRDPIVLHKEIPGMGRAKRYIITIASDDRAPLDKLCQSLIAVGATCDVLRNSFGQTNVRGARLPDESIKGVAVSQGRDFQCRQIKIFDVSGSVSTARANAVSCLVRSGFSRSLSRDSFCALSAALIVGSPRLPRFIAQGIQQSSCVERQIAPLTKSGGEVFAGCYCTSLCAKGQGAVSVLGSVSCQKRSHAPVPTYPSANQCQRIDRARAV